MTRDNEIAFYQGNLPPKVSRRMKVEFNRQMERVVATGEIGMTGLSAMSEVEQHAAFKVATTASAAEFLAKGAAATRPNATVASAEEEVQKRLFEGYTRSIAQLAEIANNKILQAVERATEQLSKRTFADTLEDLNARLIDAIAGRHNK